MVQVQDEPRATGIRPMILTHGTLEITDVQESMRFYRDFLGMEVVQHVPFGCRIALGADWYVVCLEVKHAHNMPLFNHFGFDCANREDVNAWHQRAVAERETYGIQEITSPKSTSETPFPPCATAEDQSERLSVFRRFSGVTKGSSEVRVSRTRMALSSMDTAGTEHPAQLRQRHVLVGHAAQNEACHGDVHLAVIQR